MVDETRRRLGSAAYGQSYRRLADALSTRGTVSAVVVGVGLLALLLVVFRLAPLGRLPGYPAVILAFLIAVVLPGVLLQRAVLNAGTGLLTRVAVAPALGLALAALPAFVALELHTDLDRFAIMYAVFAAAVCGESVLFWRGEQAAEPEESTADRGNPLLIVLLGVVLAGVVTTPFWAEDRLAGDFDDWTYMAYVREYLDTDRMNEAEPFLGTGEAVTPRMRDNVWVLMQALVSDASDVPPHDVLLEYLRPVLTLFAVLATYALTRTLFRGTTVAALAVAFQLGYAFLDLAPHEGMGRNLFLRISEDKMVAALVLFPVGLVFLTHYVARPAVATFAGFALVVLAVSFVHPVPLAFLGITIVSFAALRAWSLRSVRPLGPLALLLVPVAIGSVWPFVQRQLLADTAPELFGTEESAITFRDYFRVVELGGGLVIGNYHMILHPLMLAAVALMPLVWLLSRRALANQLLAAMTVGALIVFFVPLLATPLAEVMTPQTLWKVPWMIPVAPVLGYLTYEATQRLASLRVVAAERLRSLVVALAPAGAVVLALAAGLAVQEQYARKDAGAFYEGTRSSSSFPGHDRSIFLGGIDRAFSGLWRLKPYQEELFAYLERFPAGSVVLTEPQALNHILPGVLAGIHPVDFGGAAGEGERRDDVTAFINGELTEPSELDGIIDRWGVDYIAVREAEPENDPLLTYPRVSLFEEIAPYEVYAVR